MYNFFILYWYIITFSITILLTILSLKIKTSKRVYVIPWILLIIIYICYLFCNSDYNKLFIILSLLVISLFDTVIVSVAATSFCSPFSKTFDFIKSESLLELTPSF